MTPARGASARRIRPAVVLLPSLVAAAAGLGILVLAGVIPILPAGSSSFLAQAWFRSEAIRFAWVCLVLGGVGILWVRIGRGSAGRILVERTQAADRWLSVRRRGLTIAACAAILYALVWSGYSVERHSRLNSMGFDLGIQDQVVWNLSQGNGFASSIEVENYLGDHFSLVLVLLAPVYWIWADPRSLLILQSVWMAVGALAMWRLGRRYTGSDTAAVLLACGYLLMPLTGFINKYDFHILSLAAPVLFWAVTAWVERRKVLWIVLILFSLSIREEIGLAAGLLALFGLARKGWRWSGAALALVSLAWAVLALSVFIPHFRGGEASDTLARYAYLGESPGEMLANLVTRPWEALGRQAQQTRRFLYLFQLVLPTGGLSLLAPWQWTPALLCLLMGLTSDNLAQASIYFHYAAPTLPFVAWAWARGTGRALARWGGDQFSRGLVLILLVFAPLSANLLDRPMLDPVLPPYSQVYGWERHTDAEAFEKARSLIPPEAVVLCSEPFTPHLTHREKIYVYHAWRPVPGDVEFVVLDVEGVRYLDLPESTWKNVRFWMEAGRFHPLFLEGDVLLMGRDGPADPGAVQSVERRLGSVSGVGGRSGSAG